MNITIKQIKELGSSSATYKGFEVCVMESKGGYTAMIRLALDASGETDAGICMARRDVVYAHTIGELKTEIKSFINGLGKTAKQIKTIAKLNGFDNNQDYSELMQYEANRLPDSTSQALELGARTQERVIDLGVKIVEYFHTLGGNTYSSARLNATARTIYGTERQITAVFEYQYGNDRVVMRDVYDYASKHLMLSRDEVNRMIGGVEVSKVRSLSECAEWGQL